MQVLLAQLQQQLMRPRHGRQRTGAHLLPETPVDLPVQLRVIDTSLA